MLRGSLPDFTARKSRIESAIECYGRLGALSDHDQIIVSCSGRATYHRIAHAIGLDLQGAIVSLDGGYDCRKNRKAIFNRRMNTTLSPTAWEKNPEASRKAALRNHSKERFNTIERVFGWEDKFRRLLLRFERISQLHYAFKILAYTR